MAHLVGHGLRPFDPVIGVVLWHQIPLGEELGDHLARCGVSTPEEGLRRLALGVEGLELLVEPLLGRDPGIDRTADPLGELGPHVRFSLRTPKKRGPDQRVPVMANAISRSKSVV